MTLRSLRDYQIRALRYLLAQPHGALFVEMRLGKTLVVVRRWKLLRPQDARLGLRALVVAPGSALQSWEDECRLEGLDVAWLTGARRARERALAIAWQPVLPRRPLVCLINKEGWMALTAIARVPWDAVALDESHFVKNPRARVTKFFVKNFRGVPHRCVLTGTPNPEGDENYFCQLAFLDGGAFGSPDYWRFRVRWMQPHPAGFGWVLKPGARSHVRRGVARRAFTLRRRDVNLREVRVQERRVLEMPPKLRKAYGEMEELYLAELDGAQSSTRWAGGRWQAMRQMASGFFDDSLVWPGKFDELCDLAAGELARQSLVVWCCYNCEVRAAAEALSQAKLGPARALTGANSPQERRAAVREFQAGRVRVLVLQQAIAQVGMDLSAADAAVYVSCPPGQLARRQTEDRILTVDKAARGAPLLYVDLVARGTVDEDVLAAMKQKVSGSGMTVQRAIAIATKERLRWT